MTKQLELLVTLWPTFNHFERIARDERIAGIRLNSVIDREMPVDEFFAYAQQRAHGTPLYLDIKGRQLRVRKVISGENLEVVLNHNVVVKELPVVVLFKDGDPVLLKEIKDGNHLVFDGGPQYNVREGESLHIRDPSLIIEGTLPSYEKELIYQAREAGIDKFMLSFVESQSDLDEFRKYVGRDSDLTAKIETMKGLRFARQEFKKDAKTSLLTARGDLFVEVSKPHHIVEAARSIVKADPDAIAASRIMLSLTNERGIYASESIPSSSDISDLALLLGMGYKRLMLCDGLCLKEPAVRTAINIIDAYARDTGYELMRR